MSNKSIEQTLFTAGGRIKCRSCQATSKRTGQQCQAPAMRGKNVCRTHGGRSTGPRTPEGLSKCAETKILHGRETRASRIERGRISAELHRLVALGNEIGLFDTKVALRGRKPKI